jgi:cyclic pyranopterin monophosphate synthase
LSRLSRIEESLRFRQGLRPTEAAPERLRHRSERDEVREERHRHKKVLIGARWRTGRIVDGKPKFSDDALESHPMSVRQADISQKPVVFRQATATGRILLKTSTLRRIKQGKLEKGDPLAISKTMAILAVKKTPDVLALCHPLRVEHVEVEETIRGDSIEATVTVSAHEKTGVEMEALTAVSVALLNIWDVVKPYEKDRRGQYPTARIEGVHVVEKVKGNGRP